MKRLFVLFAALSATLGAQAAYTIDECWDMARANYPQIRQLELVNQSEGYNLANASKGYLPQFSLSAKATYQTEVVEIPISLPGVAIPRMNKDQYQAAVTVNQVLWDGGNISAARKNIEAAADVQRGQLEVELYAIRQRVSDLFFGILLLDTRMEINRVQQQDVALYYDNLTALMAGGMANQSDLDVVRAEQLSLQQTYIQLETSRAAYLAMLLTFMGETNKQDAELTPPELPHDAGRSFAARPEMALFGAMVEQQNAAMKSIAAKNLPRLSLFVTGAYANPGLNMFKTGWSPYAIGGVQLSWAFGNLYTRDNEQRAIRTNLANIQAQSKTFLFNMNQQRIRQEGEAEQYRLLREKDDEIIALRGSIVAATRAQVAQGVKSVSDLMHDMNTQMAARVNQAINATQFLRSRYELKILKND